MMIRRLLLALLASLFLLSSAQVAAEESPSGGEASEIEKDSEHRLLKAASSIGSRVAEIRGLELKESIQKGVKDRDQLRDMLIERFHEEVPDADFEAESLVYRRLGLFDDDLDYRELMLDLLTEQIAGFYDQDATELYIMEGLPESVQKTTMAHEIFHAIQDQHFDIGALLAPFDSRENADFALARMALIEGDAMAVMVDYELYEREVLPQNRARSFIDIPMMASMLLELLDLNTLEAMESLEPPNAMDIGADPLPSLGDSVLGNAPPIIRDTLLFPYVEGMRFVVHARSGRTWAEFDQIYTNAPVSTSQILHPERYFDGDEPLDIRFDAGQALSDYEQIYDTTFGEMKFRSWLGTHLEAITDAPAADEIASGWDGDRIHAYRASGEQEAIVVQLSTWRSEDEARAFAETLERILRFRHDATTAHHVGTHGESWCMRPGSQEEGERHFIERWGEMVLYIEGAPSRLDEQSHETDSTIWHIRDDVWDTHRRVPFREVLEARKGE